MRAVTKVLGRHVRRGARQWLPRPFRDLYANQINTEWPLGRPPY
jgi:hypothetical protein